ncbi:ATP-binding protein [Streptomyces erythrochromogenes]|uniref:ATP-binding protein n=1 Tax=Streptomyces erythrochromogenes TaxID=285574 RepID=A0ABZ1QLD5_9ACTN|nr:ATP-binding protein [Streptomyces erythrochromogenes]MCX5589108.1 ATP-binding protein [Streptomyces erythrochromogenes]
MRPRSVAPNPPPGTSCARARDYARRVLAEQYAPPSLVADVLTVVSELVSNAVRHAGGVTGFRVTVRAGQVVVEVSDRSALLPHLGPPCPHTPGGFGWRVVKTLAPSTFVRSHRTGKTVVAALPTHTGRPPAP